MSISTLICYLNHNLVPHSSWPGNEATLTITSFHTPRGLGTRLPNSSCHLSCKGTDAVEWGPQCFIKKFNCSRGDKIIASQSKAGG